LPAAAARHPDARVAHLVQWFETLTPARLDTVAEAYCADAVFKDPFNEVRGEAAVRGIYAHMYEALHEPHFVVRSIVAEGDQCFLVWDFRFRFKRYRPDWQTVRGSSHLVLAADGRIRHHRDYWDVAEELYEKLPVVGSLMRWLKRRAKS
jgi:ketosteroid isomerase-like protein